MKFNIREAMPSDAEKCADIHMRSWMFAYENCLPMSIIEQHNARRRELWHRLLENNDAAHYVITYDENVIGFLTINPPRDGDLSDDIYELTGLYLDPDYIGKGFGKQAMDWVKKEALSRGFKSLSLWVLDGNYRAKAFYEKSGFKADGKIKESGLGSTKEERYIYCAEQSPLFAGI